MAILMLLAITTRQRLSSTGCTIAQTLLSQLLPSLLTDMLAAQKGPMDSQSLEPRPVRTVKMLWLHTEESQILTQSQLPMALGQLQCVMTRIVPASLLKA